MMTHPLRSRHSAVSLRLQVLLQSQDPDLALAAQPRPCAVQASLVAALRDAWGASLQFGDSPEQEETWTLKDPQRTLSR